MVPHAPGVVLPPYFRRAIRGIAKGVNHKVAKRCLLPRRSQGIRCGHGVACGVVPRQALNYCRGACVQDPSQGFWRCVPGHKRGRRSHTKRVWPTLGGRCTKVRGVNHRQQFRTLSRHKADAAKIRVYLFRLPVGLGSVMRTPRRSQAEVALGGDPGTETSLFPNLLSRHGPQGQRVVFTVSPSRNGARPSRLLPHSEMKG